MKLNWGLGLLVLAGILVVTNSSKTSDLEPKQEDKKPASKTKKIVI